MQQIFGIFRRALNRIQWRQFAVACSAVIILLTTSGVDARQPVKDAAAGQLSPTEDVGRPRTMGQWEAENKELQGKPGQQLKRIAEESANAVKNMAEIYPENVKTLLPEVDGGELPNDD
ncbi:MAG: hypothetical protein ACFCVB_12895 [Nodosilinea sp.]